MTLFRSTGEVAGLFAISATLVTVTGSAGIVAMYFSIRLR